jgi:F-box and leucine-rich repeat protein 6
VKSEGSIPTACRLARVCRVWRDVALDTKLWRKIDLSSYFKESSRTELRLKWFIENRMLDSEEIDIGFWKVTNTMCVLLKLVEYCPQLKSLSLAGWRALSADDLKYIAEKFPKIERLDLSSINTEMNTSKTAVGLQSLVNALEIIKDRLVHLNLAHNRLCGIPQITLALTANCPNLRLLDLSNVRTIAVSHGILHIEKLQEGCQKLKVLRIANSQIQLSTASLQEQMQSPGFPELEELSVASLADESRLMSDESLQRILKSSTKLKLLDVRGCVRLHHDSLIRIPAWDLKHLFLSGCSVTRDLGYVKTTLSFID